MHLLLALLNKLNKSLTYQNKGKKKKAIVIITVAFFNKQNKSDFFDFSVYLIYNDKGKFIFINKIQMTENQTQAKTIQLDTINPEPERKIGFFEKGVQKFTGFLAKITNQPDPQTWAHQSPSQEVATQPNQSQSNSKEPSFFDKLVSSTQNLLNKTENFVSTAAEKTKDVTQKIREAPGKVVETTNTVIQKGVDIGEKVKDRAENVVDKGINFGKNLQTTMSDGAKQFTQDPLKATGNVVKGTVTSTTELGKEWGEQAKEIWENTIEGVKTTGENVKDKLKNAGQEIQMNWDKLETKATNTFWEIKEAGTKVFEKAKETWTNAFNSAKDLVKNPVNHIDTMIWWGKDTSTQVQTETENTTSLDSLEQAAEQ